MSFAFVPLNTLYVVFKTPGSLAGHVDDEMHLLPEPLFSIPTDNTYFTFICGTDSGRIFMAGKDGCLYEMVYQVGVW